MNPFQDLIPTQQANAGSPAQQAPQANPFADLIPSQQPEQTQPGFNYLKDVTGQGPQQKPTGIISSLFQNTLGSGGLAGVAQMPGRVIADAVSSGDRQKYNDQAKVFSDQAFQLAQQAHQAVDPKQRALLMKASQSALKNASDLMGIGEQAGQNNMTPGQAAGTTLNAGLTVGTGGAEGLATKAVSTGGKLALGAVEGAGLGAGYQAASNLQQNKPIQQDIVKSALIGAAIPVGTQALTGLKGVVQKTAGLSSEGIINRIIKPSVKDLGYGSEPARGILNEKITANSLGDLKNKVSSRLQSIGLKIGNLGNNIEGKIGKTTLDLNPALKPLDEAMNKAAKLNNPTLLTSLNNVKTALTHELSRSADEAGLPSITKGAPKNLSGVGYSDAIKLMEDVKQHVKFTGNPSDDKSLNVAVQDTYRNLRQIMNKAAVQADPQIGKEIINLNQRYGDLSSAQQAIGHREMIAQKNNLIDLGTKLLGGGSMVYSVAKGITTGNYIQAGKELATELISAGALKASSSTAVQTRIARFLDALAPSERAGVLQSTPVLKNLYEHFTGKPSSPTTLTQSVEKIPQQTLSELSGMNADQVKEITPFLELGRKAAQKSGMGEQYDKLIKAVQEAHIKPSFLDNLAGGGPDDTNWQSAKPVPLALPEGKIQLPSPGVLEGQSKLRGKDSGAVRQTANTQGGFSKGGVIAGVAGTTAAGVALGKTSSTSHTVNSTPEKSSDTLKIREAIAHNETRGEKDPYSFSQSSGDSRYGKALGKYQITEAELKAYAPKLLGNAISSKEFLSNPKIQDSYITKKIEYLKNRGLSVAEIFAAHRGGFSDLSKIGEKVKQYKGYVASGMSKYNQ